MHDAAARRAHPRLDHPRLVIELSGASECPCTLDDLRGADEAFLASTTREVQPIAADRRSRASPAAGHRPSVAAARLARRGFAPSSRRADEGPTVVGNRPQFIKAAAVSRPLRRAHEEVLVHTGQHFDDELSAVFFDELGLPAPDRRSASREARTRRRPRACWPRSSRCSRRSRRSGARLRRYELDARRRARRRPGGLPVAHVEAGMRSFDRSMPEELNRVARRPRRALLLCSSRWR